MVHVILVVTAWRIIPVRKWLVTMVSKSPKWGYSPYKWPKWLVNRGYYPLTSPGMILQVVILVVTGQLTNLCHSIYGDKNSRSNT